LAKLFIGQDFDKIQDEIDINEEDATNKDVNNED